MRQPKLRTFAGLVVLVRLLVIGTLARGSTYVVYIPLDSPVYEELETLNGLGYLYKYIGEIKPVSRVEAARLTLEGEGQLEDSGHSDPLAQSLIDELRVQLREEIGWLENDAEDRQPTTIHPLERLEAAYIYSHGARRFWDTGGKGANRDLSATEATPLLPDNDGIATGAGSNEVLRWSGWAGLGGFLTGYGELEASGPFTRSLSGKSRVLPLNAEAVLSLGNFALSLGQEEMWWGIGHFAALSQSDNTSPFPALRIQNIHPTLLPGFLRYLGQFRYQIFLGQLDGDRYNTHPWIDGQIVSFKPVPNFEFGFTHTIAFGGRFNDNYSLAGFFGRALGATGSTQSGNTNSRAGAFLKIHFPSLRNLEVYQEMLGEDNRSGPLGRFEPFKAVSYQGGFYLPRLTKDGRTDLRFEYTILEPNYSIHPQSLYWAYDGGLMGDPLGPNATEVDLAVGRWFGDQRNLRKLTLDTFYTERAPGFDSHAQYPVSIYGPNLAKERSGGLALDVMALPLSPLHDALASARMRIAVEYVHAANYDCAQNSVRLMLMLSVSLSMDRLKWTWR
jgi:hypothetical protein